MSDRETLRQILSSDEATPDPGDGQHLEATAATETEAEIEDDDPLSPEELVAEAVRQDPASEESAEAAPDPIAAATEETPEETETERKARLYDELQLQNQQSELDAKQSELETEIRSRVVAARQHYARELDRLIDKMEADAENTPNPAAYKRAQRPVIIASVKDAEEAWIGQIENDYTTRATAIFHERNRPLFADHLMQWAHEEYGLPIDPRVKAQLVKRDVFSMKDRMDEIVFHYQEWQKHASAADQMVREEQAKTVKRNQPHASSATSKPRRAKPVEYASSGPERKKQLAAINALR